jgi:hypothetical protein
MNERSRLAGARGAITLHTVILTLTILGLAGVVIIGVVLAFAGFTKFGVIVLGLFGAQATYGWMLYRRMPRPDIAALQYEPADEPAEHPVDEA